MMIFWTLKKETAFVAPHVRISFENVKHPFAFIISKINVQSKRENSWEILTSFKWTRMDDKISCCSLFQMKDFSDKQFYLIAVFLWAWTSNFAKLFNEDSSFVNFSLHLNRTRGVTKKIRWKDHVGVHSFNSIDSDSVQCKN